MNESKPDINKVLFMHLVSMLAMSAIQQMGKLVDPNTGKAETNLEAAQATIDMLDMLEARTRGNLDAEETRLLKDTIMSLKMNYVQTQGEKSEIRSQKPEVRDQKTDGGRQTTDDRPAKAESGAEDGGRKTNGSGTEKQTSNIQHPTSNAEGQKESGQKSASAGEDKTPKYHKKYE